MDNQIVPVSPALLQLLNGGIGSGGIMPFSREIFLLEITVAGTSYCKKINELAPQIEKGTVLRMLRDPNNEYDDMAIGIFLGKERIGFVPQELNLIIARLMDAGKAFVCRVTETTWKNKWFRVKAYISMVE